MEVLGDGQVELHHGDCLDVMGSIPDGSVDLILADLPYGTTSCKWDAVIPFEPLWSHYRRVLKPRGAVVLTACQPFTLMLVMSNLKWFRYDWTWDKVQPTGFLSSKHRPLRVCESVLVFAPGRTTYNPQWGSGEPRRRSDGGKKAEIYNNYKKMSRDSGERRCPVNLISISVGRSPNAPTIHPTQKPVDLSEYLIRTYSDEGETVLDNTMGSGTTMVACLNTGRRGIGIEKEADIFDVAQRRIEDALVRRERPHVPRKAVKRDLELAGQTSFLD